MLLVWVNEAMNFATKELHMKDWQLGTGAWGLRDQLRLTLLGGDRGRLREMEAPGEGEPRRVP